MSKVLTSSVFGIARANDTASLRSLLDFDPSVVNACGQYGDTLLLKAAAAGAYEFCRELLEAGADVNLSNNRGRTPLIEAATGGYEALVVLLASYGARIDHKDADGVDAIGAAAFGEHDGCVDALVARLSEKQVIAYATGGSEATMTLEGGGTYVTPVKPAVRS